MQIRRVTQISEAHCGAAVLQMLLEAVGVTTDQPTIAAMAEVTDTIDEHGMRVDQIALASTRIAPHAQFWYKYYASLEDIKYLLMRGIAIGVEWQGLFYKSLEEEEAEGEDTDETDYGHYSVVVYFDEETEQLVIVDPYKDFAEQNRIFDVQTFLRRWWDTNEVADARTGQRELVNDTHLLFFVTSGDEWLPADMGFKKFHRVE
jgi:hypothetical protein